MVDDALDAVLENGEAEVDQQTDGSSEQDKVGLELLAEDGQVLLARLQFHDDPVVHKQVDCEGPSNRHPAISDIDGLFDADPRTDPDAKLIPHVTELTEEVLHLAGGSGTWRGTGGMATKLNAAGIAMSAGVEMVITNGSRMEDIYGIVAGQSIGTRFLASD